MDCLWRFWRSSYSYSLIEFCFCFTCCSGGFLVRTMRLFRLIGKEVEKKTTRWKLNRLVPAVSIGYALIAWWTHCISSIVNDVAFDLVICRIYLYTKIPLANPIKKNKTRIFRKTFIIYSRSLFERCWYCFVLNRNWLETRNSFNSICAVIILRKSVNKNNETLCSANGTVLIIKRPILSLSRILDSKDKRMRLITQWE